MAHHWVPKRFKKQFTYTFETLVIALLQLVDDINDIFDVIFHHQIGIPVPFAGTTPPSGYLLCDGASYLVADYEELFEVIGYTYGGAGANFNVPDMRNRMVIGAGGLYALGATGGSATHVITKAQLPSYNLNVTDPGHNHTQNAHTHTQNSHNHTQDAHNHTQDSHNHTQNSHNHTQNVHTHNLLSTGTGGGNAMTAGRAIQVESTFATKPYLLRGETAVPTLGSASDETPTNNATTATNIATTATNDATTATNQAATATNQNTTATNIANTTGITVGSGGSGNAIPTLPPYIAMNYIMRY